MPFDFFQQGRQQGRKNQVLGIDESNVDSPRPGNRKIAMAISCSREELTKLKAFYSFLSMHLITQKIIKVYAVMSLMGNACKSTALRHLKNMLDKGLPRPYTVKFYAGSSQRAY